MQDSKSNLFWRNRKVFVTGATGLLGSAMVEALVNEGAQVSALVRDRVPQSKLWSSGLKEKITCVYGSLTDVGLLQRAFAEYEISTVFHLAAQTLVSVAKQDPVGTLEANVRGTWLLLEAARQLNVEQVLVASSDKAYGSSDNLPYSEQHSLHGRYPYDVSKSCTDLISTMYATTFALPVSIVRCGNLFGGGDLNYSRLIPGVIQATMNGVPFTIRSDGQYIRDFLYIEDAVGAYLLLAKALSERPELRGEAFNFGLELHSTILEIVRMITGLMGRSDLEPVVQNTASAEIREQYLDASKARELLSWSAQFGLEEGLKRTISWYEKTFRKLPENYA